MAHLARAGALEKLRLRECFAVAQAIDQNYVAQWISTHRTQAGF